MKYGFREIGGTTSLECLGIASNIPILWLLYGVAVHYGASFPTAIFVAWILTTILVIVVAIASFDLQHTYEGPHGFVDFVGDIFDKLSETFVICLGIAVTLSIIGLAITAWFS